MRRRRGSGIPASDLLAVVASERTPTAYEGQSRGPRVGRGGCYYSETSQGGAGRLAVAQMLLERGAEVDRPMSSHRMSTLDLLACEDRPKLRKLVRKFLAMCVRRCVLGPASEHSRRQMARDLAPQIASFLV